MAFDVGRKRIGVAVTDPSRLIANGLTTLLFHEALPFIQRYLLQEDVGLFVVGYARQSDGSDSESMAHIRPFVNSLKNKFPQMTVDWVDERFTSRLAFQTMIDGGLGRKARQDKAMVDKISATIILQSWMETQSLGR